MCSECSLLCLHLVTLRLSKSAVTFRCCTCRFISRFPNTPTVSQAGVETGHLLLIFTKKTNGWK